jgi:hypothetical protein
MKNRRRSSRPSTAIAVALLCPALLLATSSQHATVRKRIINRLSRPGEPVTIMAGQVKGKPVAFGKAFVAKDDWLGGLTLVIKNTSARSVSWVRVALSIRKDKARGIRLIDFVTYGVGRSDIDKIQRGGPPLKPGETAEVSYPLDQYQSLREILDGMGYSKSIAQIEVSAEKVSFAGEEEFMWIEGKMNRKDDHCPTGWTPLKP